MSLPKEPRQKMINLMYLVLTALLALNVSAEILNAFKIVDDSLIGTTVQVNRSTNSIMTSLEHLTTEPSKAEKAKIWLAKAQTAQALSTKTYNDIQQFRDKILKDAGFDPKKNGDSTYKKDNLDIATRIMVEEGDGKKLYQILDNYKKQLLAIDPLIAQEFANSLPIDLRLPPVQDRSNKTWESAYFHMVPTIAAITILSKFQNDVKTAENKVVTLCHQVVGQVEIKFDAFEPIVGQNSKYLMPGQELEINAGLGAFSKTNKPVINIGGSNVTVGDNGIANYKMASGGVGAHSVPVTVTFKDQDGKQLTKTFTVEYTVGQANASIALDKMNVLYVGIANPISVAASGGGDDRISVSISAGGELKKTGPGKYNAFVTSGDKCVITVSVDGKVAGASEFRIRRIPSPTGTIGGYASGDNVNAGAFKAQGGVGAYIKDFPFELKYTVTSFVISTDSDDGDMVEASVTGNTWSGNSNAKRVMDQIKPGKTVYVDNIRATGEDGRSYKLPSLVYYIK